MLEFETAGEVSRKHNGVPDVYLFRKTADVLLRADRAGEEMEQYQLLQSVWKRWTETAEGYNTADYQSFLDVDDFEQKLEACLRLPGTASPSASAIPNGAFRNHAAAFQPLAGRRRPAPRAHRHGRGLVVALCLAGLAGWQWHTANLQRDQHG